MELLKQDPDYQTERCAIHHGKLVDMFCKDHDEVCCAACIAIKHRSCINVDYLPDVAHGINNSTEYEKTKSSLENVLIELRGVIEGKTDNLKILQKDKEQLFEEIEKLKTEILMKVEELVKTSKQQVSLKYVEVKKHIQSDLDALNTILTTTTTDLRKLSEKNESQLFLNLKASKVSIRDCETFLSKLSTGKVNEKLGLVANNSLKDKLNDNESLVSDVYIESSVDVIGVKEYKATLSGKYKIDPENCEVTGICTMDDGSFVIADYTHSKLKRLNDKYTVTDFVEVGGRPYSVCRVGQNEVATYIKGKCQIQLFSLGKAMQMSSAINLGNFSFPVGVCYDTTFDAIMLCDSDKISIYSKSGNLIKIYEKNKNGDQLFTGTRQVAMNTNNQIMVVSNDNGNNVKALARDGEEVWTFTDPGLQRPWGVCILPGDIILVSGFSSYNVLQVNMKGEKISELLGASEQLKGPFALAFDKKSSRLLVGCSSNEVNVYTLSKT
ncbi:uncharacterized protein LOC132718083 [Ruditapes philippinarum]|uniref:uncharacterized protein LOC132718083 n=1 Tax=Ruditapes philippinarum TaxID=129788 RepID=UPI00295AF2EF|nr:uncharacterized protein LOC132718083 [Ruditapes philippinarum]